MNMNEPDKFEQAMGWFREAGSTAETSLNWFIQHVDELAVLSAVVILTLAILLVANTRWYRGPSKTSGWRHARRK